MSSHVENQLSAQLADSSAMFAQSALQALQEDHRVFLLHAATALEHLAKAVLAARHPSLIVAANDFEALLHACDEPTFARRPRAKMRTIGAGEAIVRAAMLGVIEAGYAPERYDEQLLECPACNTPALVSGTVRTEFDKDWDQSPRARPRRRPRLLHVRSKPSAVLRLRPRTRRSDELDAAGIAEPWVLEDVDERDFFGSDEEW